jgi:ArsR family transcriptional regulator
MEIDRLKRLISDESQFEYRTKKLCSLIESVESEDLDLEVNIFKALADQSRLTIIKLLREGELCACEITVALDKPQSTVSHHLSVLKYAGLVRERKDGKWSYFRLSEGAVIELLNQAKLLCPD